MLLLINRVASAEFGSWQVAALMGDLEVEM
jgi:hypothetical protein